MWSERSDLMVKAESWAFYLIEVIFAAKVLQNIYGFVGGNSSIGAISILILVANAGILLYIYTMQDYFGVSLGGSSRGVPS